MITDGQQTTDKGPFEPLEQASKGLKDAGVTVYGLGVGTDVNREELVAMASSPGFVFQAQSFQILIDEVENIKAQLCEGTQKVTNTVSQQYFVSFLFSRQFIEIAVFMKLESVIEAIWSQLFND